MNEICEFFAAAPDDLLATDDGTCLLRDDGCEREKAERAFLGCWRRSTPNVQRVFNHLQSELVDNPPPKTKPLLCRLGFHYRVHVATRFIPRPFALSPSSCGELAVFEVCADCGKIVEYLPRWRWWQLQKRPKPFKKKIF